MKAIRRLLHAAGIAFIESLTSPFNSTAIWFYADGTIMIQSVEHFHDLSPRVRKETVV